MEVQYSIDPNPMQVIPQKPIFLLLTLIMAAALYGCATYSPMSRADRIRTAEANLKEGHFDAALYELRALTASDPGNAQVAIDLGWVYLLTDQLEKSSRQIKWLETHDPKNPHLAHLKGAFYSKTEQWPDALDAYNDALVTEINNPELHFDIANAFLAVNTPDAALREIGVAEKLDPDNSTYEFSACKIDRERKHYDKAIEACTQARKHSDTPDEQASIDQVLQSIELLQQLNPTSKLPADSEKTPQTAPITEDKDSGPAGFD